MKFLGGVAAASMIVTLAGCTDGATRADEPATSAATSSETTETASTVVAADLESKAEVLDAGAVPRRELRYGPEVGATQRSTMVMTGSTTVAAEGRRSTSPLGPITSVTTTEVVDVADNGDITFIQTIDDMTVEGPDDAVAQTRPLLDQMVGLEVEMTIDPVGNVVGDGPDAPSVGNPMADQLMGTVFDQLAQGFTALPVEPVGRGATWRVPLELDTGGLTLSAVTRYSLTDVDGTRIRLETRQEQSAEPTRLAGVRVDSVSAEGAGTVEVDLASLLPTSSRMDLTQEMAMTVEQGGRSVGLDQRTKMSMRMTSR